MIKEVGDAKIAHAYAASTWQCINSLPNFSCLWVGNWDGVIINFLCQMWQTLIEAQTGSEGGYALSSTQSKKACISCDILDKAKGTYKIHK